MSGHGGHHAIMCDVFEAAKHASRAMPVAGCFQAVGFAPGGHVASPHYRDIKSPLLRSLFRPPLPLSIWAAEKAAFRPVCPLSRHRVEEGALSAMVFEFIHEANSIT
ncbi:MAG: hypothetical protein GC184_07020 [Rhizobiales bacterium]|nr:hypothetical protein [Hyphomicrobiales bacterium]